jgi:hypothetical protein
LNDPTWLQDVDAARLLTDLFVELTPIKEEYRKTKHSNTPARSGALGSCPSDKNAKGLILLALPTGFEPVFQP